MFEKEAEEYSESTKTEKEIEILNTVHYWGSESLSPEERYLFDGIQERKRAREQGFKDGAEFGYNKANEWHYVKDGDLPKENENVLIYSNRANHIGFYRNGFWFTNSDGCLEDDDIEVIAWKEIVLPKEIKENDE